MSHENEAIFSKLCTNRYSHVIFDTLKSTVLHYSITWIKLIIFQWEVFQFGKFNNIPNFQLDESIPDTLKQIYPIMRCIIDYTELSYPKSSSSLKVP